MNFEEQRKIKFRANLKKSAADLFGKNQESITEKELSITWTELVIYNFNIIKGYFGKLTEEEFYSEKNTIYQDAVQGAFITLNRILPSVPFEHQDLPHIFISMANIENNTSVGFGIGYFDFYQACVGEDDSLVSYIPKLKKILKELKSEKKPPNQKDLEWCTDYKYATKISNSIWTVKN